MIVLSHEPDAKYWSLIAAKLITDPKWPNKYLIGWKLIVFQIIIDLSLEQLESVLDEVCINVGYTPVYTTLHKILINFFTLLSDFLIFNAAFIPEYIEINVTLNLKHLLNFYSFLMLGLLNSSISIHQFINLPRYLKIS